MSRVSIDEIATAIIEQLRQDGRRSYAAIGKAVGLSEAAVRQRVQRLIDTDVMKVVAVTDPKALGLLRRATLGIRVDGVIEPVATKLGDVPEVDTVVITAGSFDLLVDVACRDDEHLLALLSRTIRKIPGVNTTEAFVHLHD